MKSHFSRIAWAKGVTLMESVISLGVLAVAVPLVFAALGEAGRMGGDSAQDNRSASIIPACIDAIERARDGTPGWFRSCPAGTPFPPDGEIWALAFSSEGLLVGRATKEQYEQGIRYLEGSEVRYLASLAATSLPDRASGHAPLHLTITIEHPAAQPGTRRKRSGFHSLLR